ncbi:hypothetical protein SK128_004360 [Halocaridina rubra]|uniref:Uncharacterized protein n=1 Tax=Halocaridina rubra TaxID=373956 RepID=A0AAN8XA17_HALRR
MAEDVSTLLEGVISSQPPNCHLVMIGGSTDTSFFNEFLRRRVETKLGVVLIDTARMTNSSELQDNAQLTEIFTGETTTSCRMLIIAFSYSESDDILE